MHERRGMRLVHLAGLAVLVTVSSALAQTTAPVLRAPTIKKATTAIKATEADAARVKLHAFKPPHVALAVREDTSDGPAIIAARKTPLKPGPSTPKLNVAKFGESIHAVFKDNVRGYALGLRKNGQPVLTLIWDVARSPAQGNKGWTLDTRMHVASVSKLMTGIIATKMLDERNLSFDTKIGPYLPTYWNEADSSEDLTFRQLLTHKAGFTIYDGDFASFKRQIEMGVSPGSASALDYTNGSFSLVRVLTATMTGAVNKSAKFEVPLPGLDQAQLNDLLWDVKATDAFVAYAQAKVFTPAGVANVGAAPTSTSALAYSGKTDTTGWNSGDVSTQLGGAGFRLSVNDVLDVMGTFRRKGTIVSPQKAKEALDAKLGIDRIIDTPAGKLYDKNGAWRDGKSTSNHIEQSVAVFMPEEMECVVLVNSWVGTQQASLRNAVRDAYLANLE